MLFCFNTYRLSSFFFYFVLQELNLVVVGLLFLSLFFQSSHFLIQQPFHSLNGGFVCCALSPLLLDLSLKESDLFVSCLASSSQLKVFVVVVVGKFNLGGEFSFQSFDGCLISHTLPSLVVQLLLDVSNIIIILLRLSVSI